MTPERALTVVALDLIARASERIDWEDLDDPDGVSEDDWETISKLIDQEAFWQPASTVKEAYAVLKARADG